MFKSTFAAALFAAMVAAKDGKDFKGDEYISLSRADKSDKIWAKITENPKSGSWHFAETLFVGQTEVFTTKGDEFDCSWTGCRNKTIHSIGNVGKVKWVSEGDHAYSGIFKGADYGYVRMSSAAPVDTKTPNIKPGMGVKFLRDGVDSANFVSMFGVDGQNDLNFFANDWSNHIPTPTDKTLIPLALRFKTATPYIQTVGLSDMAAYAEDGTAEADVSFPWSLRFEPTGEFSYPSTTYDVPFETYLATTIPTGSTLFNIYATDLPTELGGTEQLIGKLVTDSNLVTSNWGDDHMYFRHQLMEDDLKYHPEWEQYVPNYQVFGTNLDDNITIASEIGVEIANKVISNCPFARFFQ